MHGKAAKMKKVFCVISLMIGTIGMLSPAAAESPQCGPKMAVADQLAQQFGEVPIVSGISLNNSMRFFGNPRTGSWSMIFVRPDGVACVLAVGEDLEVSSLAFTQNTGAQSSAPDQFRLVK
jgi:hypothetical protein